MLQRTATEKIRSIIDDLRDRLPECLAALAQYEANIEAIKHNPLDVCKDLFVLKQQVLAKFAYETAPTSASATSSDSTEAVVSKDSLDLNALEALFPGLQGLDATLHQACAQELLVILRNLPDAHEALELINKFPRHLDIGEAVCVKTVKRSLAVESAQPKRGGKSLKLTGISSKAIPMPNAGFNKLLSFEPASLRTYVKGDQNNLAPWVRYIESYDKPLSLEEKHELMDLFSGLQSSMKDAIERRKDIDPNVEKENIRQLFGHEWSKIHEAASRDMPPSSLLQAFRAVIAGMGMNSVLVKMETELSYS